MSDDKSAQASSKSLPALRNSRIVRVSRAFGGKDRHSKVTTIRGLRDRRIRLSVPTAIQLYDLQDKLGLSQPSKAVDWLLNAAQQEIDKLPPLEMVPGSFNQLYPRSLPISQLGSSSTNSLLIDHSFNDSVNEGSLMLQKSTYNWHPNALLSTNKDRSKEHNTEKGNSSKQNELQNQDCCLNINYGMPYSSYYQLESSQEQFSHSHLRNQFPPHAYGVPVYMAGTSCNLDQKQFSHSKTPNFNPQNISTDPDAFRSYLQTSRQNLPIDLQPNNNSLKHNRNEEQDHTIQMSE